MVETPRVPAQTPFEVVQKTGEAAAARSESVESMATGEDWQREPQYSLRPAQNNPPSSH